MEKYLEKLNKLPQKQQMMVLAGTILGIVGVFYLLLISPASSDAAAAVAKTKKAQQKLRELKASPTKKKKIDPKNDPKVLKAKLDLLVKKLAKGGAYPNLVNHLKRKADDLGLKITKISRDEPYLDDFVIVSPIRIEAEAAFPVVVSFLHQLAHEKAEVVRLEADALATAEAHEERASDGGAQCTSSPTGSLPSHTSPDVQRPVHVYRSVIRNPTRSFSTRGP